MQKEGEDGSQHNQRRGEREDSLVVARYVRVAAGLSEAVVQEGVGLGLRCNVKEVDGLRQICWIEGA